MGGPETFEQQVVRALGEKEMADLGRLGGGELRAERIAANLAQRTHNAARIARELHRRRIGEKFALTGHGGLNEPAEEVADIADDHRGQSNGENHGQAAAALAAHAHAAPAEATEDAAADQADHENAKHDGRQLHVQPHVAIQDVAEFVRDHSLQLVAAQLLHRAAGDGHHGIAGREAGGEGIEAGFIIEHVDGGDGHPRGDGHLLDHVEQAALLQIDRVRFEAPAADAFGDGRASRAKDGPFVERAASNDDQRAGGDCQQERRVEPDQLIRGVGRLRTPDVDQRNGRRVAQDDGPDDGQGEQHDKPSGPLAGTFLSLEEVHREKG